MACAVKDCKSNRHKDSDKSFFGFPSKNDLLKTWVKFCNQTKPFNKKTWRICSDHFRKEDIFGAMQCKMGFSSRTGVYPGAVPCFRVLTQENEERAKRAQQKENKQIDDSLLNVEDTIAFTKSITNPYDTIKALMSDCSVEMPEMDSSRTFKFADPIAKNKVLDALVKKTRRPNPKTVSDQYEVIKTLAAECSVEMPEIDSLKTFKFTDPTSQNKVVDALVEKTLKYKRPYIKPVTNQHEIVKSLAAKHSLNLPEIESLETYTFEDPSTNRKIIDSLLNITLKRRRRSKKGTCNASNASETLTQTNKPPRKKGESKHLKMQIKTLSRQLRAIKQENESLEILCMRREGKLKNDLLTLKKGIMTEQNQCRDVKERLREILNVGEITKTRTADTRDNWAEADFAKCVTLHAVCAEGYRSLLEMNISLPTVRTLQRWVQKLEFNPGILQTVLNVLAKIRHLKAKEKICVLNLSEMELQKSSEAKNVQVGILKGLLSNWEQPVFYDFDCQITADILKTILKAIKESGFNVTAIVCDQKDTYTTLLKDLQINQQNLWFIYETEKVFVFHDVLDLLQLLQDNYSFTNDITDQNHLEISEPNFMLTKHHCKKVLWNLFGEHGRPDQQEFQRRLKEYLLGYSVSSVDTEFDCKPKMENADLCLTGTILSGVCKNFENMESNEEEIIPMDLSENDDFEDVDDCI